MFQDGGRLAAQVAADLARTIQDLEEVTKARSTARTDGGTSLLFSRNVGVSSVDSVSIRDRPASMPPHFICLLRMAIGVKAIFRGEHGRSDVVAAANRPFFKGSRNQMRWSS
jgi:hypothetical protein